MKKIILSCYLITCVFTFAQAKTIEQKLSGIPGLRFQEIAPSPFYRVFEMYFRQPVDHHDTNSPTFEQKLILWHLNEKRPMTLETSGYSIFAVGLSALSREFDTNQIQVEHRYFSTSIPQSPDWTLDNIEQSAYDFHRITEAFKTIYPAKWMGTGRSKGGMTSIFHRRFFPNDLDATIAHVTPISFSLEDERYADFVENRIGGEKFARCRAKLVDTQKILLANKYKILADVSETKFTQLGSKTIAAEHAIIELPWAFWQYHGPDATCSNVPGQNPDVHLQLDFLNKNNDPHDYTDPEIVGFLPYYFQAATQLGNPGTNLAPIISLLDFANTYNIHTYVDPKVLAEYDQGKAMNDVKTWVDNESERIIFVYGEFDPWSAGAYTPRTAGDSYSFTVAGANHGAQITNLQGEAQDLAYKKVRSWMHISAARQTPKSLPLQKSLEQMEFEAVHIKH